MNFAIYLTSRTLSTVPALWLAGWLLSQSRVSNALIPYILAALGAVAAVLLDGGSLNSVAQGIVAAALAVFGHQVFRQGAAIIARAAQRQGR